MKNFLQVGHMTLLALVEEWFDVEGEDLTKLNDGIMFGWLEDGLLTEFDCWRVDERRVRTDNGHAADEENGGKDGVLIGVSGTIIDDSIILFRLPEGVVLKSVKSSLSLLGILFVLNEKLAG